MPSHLRTQQQPVNEPNLNIEPIFDEAGRTELGESPVWDEGTGAIWWVDIDGRKLLRTDATSRQIKVWDTPEMPGFVVMTDRGRPAVGMQSGIFLFDPDSVSFELMIGCKGEGQRFNDATVGPDGRLWASTMGLEAQPGQGAIHLVTPGLELQTAIEGLRTPNGMVVDEVSGRFYYSDSHPDTQTAWFHPIDVETGSLGGQVHFVDFRALGGRPDGAALDSAGRYWIAGVDGSALYVFDPVGQLEQEIPVPFPAPTKPAFLGRDARSLAITSKGVGQSGGYLALATMPESWPSGQVLPPWTISR